MTLKPWKLLSSKYLIEDKYMKLRADTCQNEAGVLIDPYYVQEPPDWVHVVAFDKSHDILLTKQYRHATGDICIELPCGCVDAGESPQAAMERELLEETGCKAGSWEPLPRLASNPARFSNWAYPFIAYDAQQVAEQNLDEMEEIEFSFYPVADVLEMIEQGEFTQAIHLSSLLIAIQKLNNS